MTRDEIIDMVRQAGFSTGTQDWADGNGGFKYAAPLATGNCLVELEAFAKLVAAKEREACEQIADKHTKASFMGAVGAAIRARGEA